MDKQPISANETPWRVGDDIAPLRVAFQQRLAQTSPEPAGLAVMDAHDSRIRTVDGRRLVDWLSGIGVANTGHGLEPVVRAVAQQAARHMHVMVYGEYVQETQLRLAELLVRLVNGADAAAGAPGSGARGAAAAGAAGDGAADGAADAAGAGAARLDSVYFTNSGAEAAEGAIKLVRKATGRTRIVAFDGAYHGDTTGAQALSGNADHRAPFEPLLPGVVHLPFDDATALESIDQTVAGVFVEPVQAEAGVRLPSPGFLPALAARCRDVGALWVADEVQVGLGRTGRWLASAEWGVAPDVLLLAKALGGGLPLGAFVASQATMASLAADPPLSHLTTFGGHPVSCAAGLAALGYARDRDLPLRGEAVGARLERELRQMCARVAEGRPQLVDLRRRGLILGLEFDRPARPLIEAALEEGVIVGDCLWAPNVVKIMPPLTIEQADLEDGLARFARALGLGAA